MSRTTFQFSVSRLAGIIAIGVVALVAAMFYRQHLQSLRKSQMPPPLAKQAQPVIEELRTLKLAANQNAKNVQRRWDLVSFYERNQMLPQAMIQLDTILRLEPDNEKANIELANLLLASNQYKTAEQAFLDITHRFPRSAEGWQGLSAVYFQGSDYLSSMHAAQEAYRLKPELPENKLALAAAELNYALQFTQTDTYAQQYEQARALLTELTKTWPDNGQVFFLLGRTLRVMRRFPEAIPVLKRAQELQPDNADAVAELARSYSFSGDRVNARKVVESAINANVRSANLYGLYAQLVQQAGEPNSEAKGVEAYENAVRLAPRDIAFRERLGSAYLRVGRVEDARKIFEQMVLEDPNRSYPYQQLAAIYSRMGQRERSAAAATMATRMAANENQMHQIQLLSTQHPENPNLHLILADRYMDLRQPGPAKDEYSQALKTDPKNARAKKGLTKLELLKSSRANPAVSEQNQLDHKRKQ